MRSLLGGSWKSIRDIGPDFGQRPTLAAHDLKSFVIAAKPIEHFSDITTGPGTARRYCYLHHQARIWKVNEVPALLVVYCPNASLIDSMGIALVALGRLYKIAARNYLLRSMFASSNSLIQSAYDWATRGA